MLPPSFQSRMSKLLGESEARALFEALKQETLKGLRVNTNKLSIRDFQDLSPFDLSQVPWADSGFRIAEEVKAGKHPFFAAGLYYLQEPSAMAVAEVVAPKAGELVLDLAAAPGGKTTQLIALTKNQSTVIANDVNRKRCRALIENLERWGAQQAVITNESIAKLATTWGAIFDRVLLDAPCSGEGMFRKSENAREMWSETNIQNCAIRQHELIDDAARLVKSGGYLVYSTCTFAPEENEQVIDRFLTNNPEFRLEPISFNQVSSGVPEWASGQEALELSVRLWPHKVQGEGHFVALLKNVAGETPKLKKHKLRKAEKKDLALWQDLAKGSALEHYAQSKLVVRFGDQLYAIPELLPNIETVNALRVGLRLGSILKNRFEPAHALALAISKEDAAQFNHINLDAQDERVTHYLQGNILEQSGEKGWLLVCVNGFPLGWAKRSASTLKNALPKGLRWLS